VVFDGLSAMRSRPGRLTYRREQATDQALGWGTWIRTSYGKSVD
jgi:hypothetical protein